MRTRIRQAKIPSGQFTENPSWITLEIRASKFPDERLSLRFGVLLNVMARVARLGGYLDRAGDSPPGNLVMWRGMSRLIDIHLGVLLPMRNVGK